MPALRVRMQFDRNSNFLQRHVVTERVLDAINVVVFILEEECRRSLERDMIANIRIQLDAIRRTRQMTRI